MALNEHRTDTWLTFEHDIGACGCKFETRVSMLKDFPERIICPGCPAVENQQKTKLLKELGNTAAKFLELKATLERDFNLKIVGGII